MYGRFKHDELESIYEILDENDNFYVCKLKYNSNCSMIMKKDWLVGEPKEDIKELCYCFIELLPHYDKDKNIIWFEHIFWYYLKEEKHLCNLSTGQTKDLKDFENVIYGSIWTNKGLSYVCKFIVDDEEIKTILI